MATYMRVCKNGIQKNYEEKGRNFTKWKMTEKIWAFDLEDT
jgi:hypothetical protein